METPITQQDTNTGDSGQILKPAVQVTALSLANIAVGFLLQVVLAAQFGAGTDMDAFLAATTVPTTITAILLGALSITFVPVFTEYRTMGGEIEAWQVASRFISLLGLTLMGISLLGIVFAAPIIRLTTPGFTVGSPPFMAAIQMSRIIYPTILFIGLAASFSGISYAEKQFIRPSAAPVINNMVIIVGSLLLIPAWGINGIAWATLFGAIAQLVLMSSVGQGRFFFSLNIRHPGVRQTLVVMAPLLLGGLIFRSNTLVDRLVASLLAPGTISHLGYAVKILNILWTITSAGIIISLFPLQSQHAQNKVELGRTTTIGLRLAMILTLGIGGCFLVLRHTAVQVLFERGAFAAADTHVVANLLLFYSGALFIPSIVGSVTYALYAMQKTGLTTLVAVIGALLNFLLLLPLVHWLGANGVALAYSIASIFNAGVLIWLLAYHFQVPLEKNIWACLIKSLICMAAAGIVTTIIKQRVCYIYQCSPLQSVIMFTGLIACFSLTYLVLLMALRVDDVWLIWQKTRFKLGLQN